MKKVFALILATMMLLSFAACGEDKTEDPAITLGTNSITLAPDASDNMGNAVVATLPGNNTQDATDSDYNFPTIGDDAVTPNEDYTDAPVSVTTPSDTSITRGIITGNIYQNAIGLKITVPSNWKFYTDDELLSLMGASADLIDLDNFDELVDAQTVVYDMGVQNPTTGDNLLVSFENTLLTAGKICTEEEYLDNVVTALTSMGYNFEETKSVYLSGETYLCASASTDIYGVPMTQHMLCRSVGNYMLVISATSTGSTSYSQFAAMFG